MSQCARRKDGRTVDEGDNVSMGYARGQQDCGSDSNRVASPAIAHFGSPGYPAFVPKSAGALPEGGRRVRVNPPLFVRGPISMLRLSLLAPKMHEPPMEILNAPGRDSKQFGLARAEYATVELVTYRLPLSLLRLAPVPRFVESWKKSW
jgi:hypothetical protein